MSLRKPDVGYLAFLAEKYQEQLSRVAGVDVHGRYGHGHIVVTVGRHLWRYEPLALVEIA